MAEKGQRPQPTTSDRPDRREAFPCPSATPPVCDTPAGPRPQRWAESLERELATELDKEKENDMTDHSRHRVDPFAARVSRDTVVLNRDETGWLLTHSTGRETLRLRIQRDEVADADIADHITFEVQSKESAPFVSVGDAIVRAYDFSPESQQVLGDDDVPEEVLEIGELPRMPCVCDFPTAFREAFVKLVSRWGHLKTVCIFEQTVAGTPFPRPPVCADCRRCHRPIATLDC